MKAIMQCNTCFKRGNGEWAGWHKANIHDTSFTLLSGGEDEPPQNPMGLISRIVPTDSALAKRLAVIRELWSSPWSVPPIRNFLFFGCNPLFIHFWEER